MILDEGHVIRNFGSKQAKAACLLKAERRWVISGTPVQNTLNDLYRCVEQDTTQGRGRDGKSGPRWTGNDGYGCRLRRRPGPSTLAPLS